MPQPFEWMDKYSVGVQSLDDDHRGLLTQINRVMAAIEAHDEGRTLADVLDHLVEYSVVHFDREETLMEQTAYPALESHRRSHDRLIRRLLKFLIAFRMNELTPVDLGVFLMDWLVDHIEKEDKHYSAHFRQHGIC